MMEGVDDVLCMLMNILLVVLLVAWGGSTSQSMPGMPVMTTAPSPPTSQRATPGAGSITPEGVKQQHSGYSLEQAQREGYKPDGFCLSATDFGLPATLGAMGFHATDESRLMGPIVANRPQALVFDQTNRAIAVEYDRYATGNPARLIQAGLCLPTTLDYLKSTRFIMLLDA